MLSCLDKHVKQIEKWQEHCSELQLFLKVLLGEEAYNENSIADIAVNKNAFKKKSINEAELAGDVKDKDKSGNDVIVTPEGKTKKLTKIQARAIQTNGDEDVSPLQDVEEPEPKNEKETTRTKILKTEKIMETNTILNKWVDQYFSNRRKGNFTEANIIKNRIENMIREKNLDKETVYYNSSSGDILEPEDSEDSENSENSEE